MNKTRFHDYGTQAVLLQNRRMLMIKLVSILFLFIILAVLLPDEQPQAINWVLTGIYSHTIVRYAKELLPSLNSTCA
ncbi:hypothetical protein ACDQ55_18755 [Chitinophaga sp. 30R24]|uniref:hypothetical protein n=1 Tax=Chitinophaga sp. 30R24 TaxID=3248838 RepID=UPI003B903FD0